MSRFLRRGFTLAEMLIVIAVIGVLSSMMMVASSESVRTSKAGNIIATLQNFASAAMTFYTDSMDYFTKDPSHNTDIDGHTTGLKGWVMKYMYNGGNSVQDKDSYTVLNHWDATNKISTWWAGYNVGNDSDSTGLKERLKNRADSANLNGTGTATSNINTAPTKNGNNYRKYNGENIVWLLIRTNGK